MCYIMQSEMFIFVVFQKIAYAITPEKEYDLIESEEVRQFTVSYCLYFIRDFNFTKCLQDT